MKVTSFHLMSYPGLPEDFAEKHRSVWVDVDPRLFDAHVVSRAYNDFLDELEYAAVMGFDGLGINEHHANGYAMMTSPNLGAMALARRTQDAALVILGDSIALYNPPIRVAEELALIDCVSGGRVVAGFPVGSPMDTIFAYSQNPVTLRERYFEAVELVKRAWTSDEVFSFNGRYTKMRYVNCLPRPLQKPHPPIWIPGGSSKETWEWACENDHVYLFLSYFGYKAAQAVMKGYWERRVELGKDPNPFAGGYVQFVGVADSEAEALSLYREPAEYFFNRSLHLFPGFADPPGYKTVGTVRDGVEGMIERAARESAARAEMKLTAAAKLTFEEMVAKGYVVIGDPTQVAEKLNEIATDLNIGQLLLLLHFGNMSKELAMHNIRLMSEKVLPDIKGLFADQWEDRWWINPVQPSAAPEGAGR
jgi:alkanesulfonate monooxygenase SsuD/methylene tetrahydromethanopterin reductase-like flavin-dependent oxidoreductase (luciferase family)